MNLCRLCLTKTEASHSLYGDNGGDFSSLAPIVSRWFQVSPNDSVSTIICAYCWKNTLDFHLFCCKVVKAQHDFFKDSTFVKPVPFTGNDALLAPGIVNSDCAVVNVVLEYQPKAEAFDLNEFKVECVAENEKDLHYHSDSYLDDIASNALTTIKPEELSDSSGGRSFSPIHPDPVKMKRRLKTINRVKQIEKSNDKTSSSNGIKSRKMEDDRIRQFCNMFCDFCTTQFRNFADASNHYREYHGIQGYLLCCNTKIISRDLVIEHIQIHMNPESVKLNDGLELQKCMQTQDSQDKKSFQCDQCPKKYARNSLLTRHKFKGRCKKEDKTYGCDICQKNFLIKSVLKKHIMRSHVPEVCDYCGKQFKGKYYLNVHRNEAHMGKGIARLQCHVCGIWMRGSNLSKHVKTHRIKLHPEPRSTCTICSKDLKNKIVLKRHMNIVHGNRKHQCNVCDKKFGIPLSLKEHMAVHTGEDLYKCRYCTRTFKSNANMHAHRKKSHFKEWEKDRGKRLIDGRYQ